MDNSPDWARGASWSSIPTDLLHAELQRRQDDGDKPQCGSSSRGKYDTTAHVLALLLILALSTLFCAFPLISSKTTTGKRQKIIIFYCGHGGTGVLLATAFVHLLPTAFMSMTDPCLPDFFSHGYKPLAGLVAMISALVVVAVESYLTARGAGHSHSHGHEWGDDDDDDNDDDGMHVNSEPLRDMNGLARRRAGSLRPADLDVSREDMESRQGLVAGVSPLPESTPTTAQNGQSAPKTSDPDFNDDDSDLDFEAAGLAPAPSSSHRSGPYASLKPGRRDDDHAEASHRSPEDQQRQLMQCLLLEAGILFHSIFIGMAISVATGPAFVVFLVAISFHQSFEGLALGTRIAAIQFPRKSMRPWLMVLAYGTTTPIGQAIGLVVHRLYDPQSMGGLLVVGFMNAISAGLLVYAALVQLLAEDFLSETSFRVLKGKRRTRAFIAVIGGAFLMALVGAFA